MPLLIVLLVLFILILYFLPSIVAVGRSHNSKLAIIALNILLGWTCLGWIIAFIWSLTGNVGRKQAPIVRQVYYPPWPERSAAVRRAGATAAERHRWPRDREMSLL